MRSGNTIKALLLLRLLLAFVSFIPDVTPRAARATWQQNPAATQDGAPVVVLSHKWSRDRQPTTETLEPGPNTPAPSAMLPANRNFERQRRTQAAPGPGERDPNADTVDGRSAALEKSVQSARGAPKPADGFAYRMKAQNANTKVIEVLFWEYQFYELANPSVVTRRQFLCGVNIKPGKKKDVQAFILSGPSDVISVSTLGKKSGDVFQEKVLINRVEFADGSIWQRKDWHLSDVKLGYERALRTSWGTEMCRGL